MYPMPPTLRSTATTPTKKSGTTTPASTPRKKHHCKTCGRPRAGHPRQGCPFADTVADNEPETITDSLGSMNIVDSSPIPPRKYTKRMSKPDPELFPDASLASLSESSKNIIESLKKPGIMSNASDDESGGVKTQRITPMKQKKNAAATATPSGVCMPGTLHTPNPSFFEPTQPQTVVPANKTPAQRTRPVVRSLSMEEREAFLADLHEASKVPPACVYVFPMQDIPRIKRAAEKAGFHVCVVNVSGPMADKNATDGWLILGREKQAVQLLKAEVEYRRKDDHTDERKGAGITLQAVAGGAVVGAVATFTGLAFA